jgi:hypothetical protein
MNYEYFVPPSFLRLLAHSECTQCNGNLDDYR